MRLVVLVCLAAPWLTRALLLSEKHLPLRFADLRGVLADGSVALGVAGLIGLFLWAGRWWGRAFGWLVLMAFIAASFAIYEFISVFDSLYALSHVGFLGDATFLKGSALHVRHPLLLGVLALAGTLAVFTAATPRSGWWRAWGIGLTVCVLGHAVLPMSQLHDGWRQRHAVHAQASMLPASAKLGGAGTVGAEVREVFVADLDGERWVGPLEGRPNVLLIMIEGASAPLLPSVAKATKIKASASMPKLDEVAKEHLLFSRVISHQRQTNRGEYAILCGDYPKLLTDQSKMTEQVYGEPRRCLPAVLLDAGYATAYIQAAPLPFMLKDQFMKKAGFDELIGDESFEKSYVRTDWGVDDKAFFEQALDRVIALHDADQPFFAAMLTVGTHHPLTFPDADPDESESRVARAFAYADDALDGFLESLEESGVLEDTVVIITSDESGGMVDSPVATARLLAQNWSFGVVMLPEPTKKKVDTLYQHADLALSVLDLLALRDDQADFIGRSWFREYETPRLTFAANTYARKVVMWGRNGKPVVCDEAFRDCKRYGIRKAELVPNVTGKPAFPRERRLVAEVARLTRSGRASMTRAQDISLSTAEQIYLSAADGKKLLSGGQYLRVPGGTILRVTFDLEVEGPDAEAALIQDVFLGGHKRFARRDRRLRSGERWRLEYELPVAEDEEQLVVQLYATGISEAGTTLHIREARLSMRPGEAAGDKVRILNDTISSSAP